MQDWNTKDYNKLYKNYVYIVIGQEAPMVKDLPISFTVYYKWYDNTYIRIKK